MANEFLTFKKFTDPNLATEFTNLLDSEKIEYQVEDASPTFDVTFANNSQDKEIHIKLSKEDFERVEQLIDKQESKVSIEDVPEDYYLLTFSNEELMEILMKPDEWSSLDYHLSQKLLKERGKDIDQELIQTLKKKRYEELSKPEESQKSWINAGYLFAFLGGLIGIFIGWHLLTFKRTLPNGERVYGYIQSDRKSGQNILIISLISTTLQAVIWIYTIFN